MYQHQPATQVPPEFMNRYEAIMNGDEKLDTVAKLKDFWLFAIEQGWKTNEARELIAGLVLNASWKWTSYLLQKGNSEYLKAQISYLTPRWSDMEYIGPSPYPEEKTNEEFSDYCWRVLQDEIQWMDVTKEK